MEKLYFYNTVMAIDGLIVYLWVDYGNIQTTDKRLYASMQVGRNPSQVRLAPRQILFIIGSKATLSLQFVQDNAYLQKNRVQSLHGLFLAKGRCALVRRCSRRLLGNKKRQNSRKKCRDFNHMRDNLQGGRREMEDGKRED